LSHFQPLDLGLVVAVHGRHVMVETPDGGRVLCHPRGKKSELVVGDRVRWLPAGDEGVVEHLEARRNLLFRQDEWRTKSFAANIDQLLMLVSGEPMFGESQLARALVAAEAAGIPAVIGLNKVDLPAADTARERLAPYAKMGLAVVELALKTLREEARSRLGPLLAGRSTLVLGPSGSGKSTLVNLIPRFFDATAGTVAVNGTDVRDQDLERLWDSIGLVPQRAFLFSGTVASNLRFGRPEATEAELWHALTVAQARDFVASMPGQLDAPIDQGGTNVSGGQRQRLSIARALVKRPRIYLFDDCFSALDATTDARLRAALRADTQDATVVIVAQRVSTIMDADQIIMLDEGRIAGIGTHQHLLMTCDPYREIVSSQLGEGVAA
jgi:ABC-type proline/glycine betaine transport system ATPase subunit